MHQWRREAIKCWANKTDFNATGYAKRAEETKCLNLTPLRTRNGSGIETIARASGWKKKKASNTKQTTTINCRICSRFRQIIDRCQHENVFFDREAKTSMKSLKAKHQKRCKKLISISPRAHNCCVSHTPRHKFLRNFFAILFRFDCKSLRTIRARSEKFASNPKLIPRFFPALCKLRPVHCFEGKKLYYSVFARFFQTRFLRIPATFKINYH